MTSSKRVLKLSSEIDGQGLHLLSEFSNFSSLSDMLSKEISGTDVNEAEVPDDPVGDGALAGTGSTDNQGAKPFAIGQALEENET